MSHKRPQTAASSNRRSAGSRLRPQTSQGFRASDTLGVARPGTAQERPISARVEDAFQHGYKGIKLGESSRRAQTARPSYGPRDTSGKEAGQVEIAISKDAIHAIFLGKCKDLGLKYSLPREKRFVDLMNKMGQGKTLNLSENGLGPQAGVQIARALAGNNNYIHLKLTNNLIRDKGAVALAKALKRNRTLITIALQSNDIGPAGGEALFLALCENTSVTQLDISALSGINRNHIGQRGADALGQCLSKNRSLLSLGINMNGIGIEGAQSLSRGLTGNKSLVRLDLSGNNLTTIGVEAFCAALPSTRLSQVNLSRNNIGDEGVEHIADALLSHDHMSNLDLSHNGITQDGIGALATMIHKGRNTISTLNLSHNSLGAKGAIELAESLKLDQSLTSLNLSHNDIVGDGLDRIGYALADNLVLSRIELNDNLLRDSGAKGIAAMMEGKCPLTFVDLSTNKIKDEGGLALAKALRSNGQMRHLNLRNNMFHDTTGNALAKSMATNTTLTFIDIEYNDINYQNFSFIERTVKANAKSYKDGTVGRLAKQVDHLAPAETKLEKVSKELQGEKRELREAELMEKKASERLMAFVETHDEGSNALMVKLQQVQEDVERAELEVERQVKANAQYKADAELKCSSLGGQLTRETDKRNLYEKKILTKERELEELTAQIEEAEKVAKAELDQVMDAAKVVISACELDIARLEKLEQAIAGTQGPTSPSQDPSRPPSPRASPSRPAGDSGSGNRTSRSRPGSARGPRPGSAGKLQRPSSARGKAKGKGKGKGQGKGKGKASEPTPDDANTPSSTAPVAPDATPSGDAPNDDVAGEGEKENRPADAQGDSSSTSNTTTPSAIKRTEGPTTTTTTTNTTTGEDSDADVVGGGQEEGSAPANTATATRQSVDGE